MKYLVALLLSFTATSAFAIFCPSNFSVINYGDSLSSVMQACGAPASQTSYVKPDVVSQLWTFYVPLGSGSRATGAMKVVINEGSVVNITIPTLQHVCDNLNMPGNPPGTKYNEANCPTIEIPKSVTSTTRCGGLISLGDASSRVQAVCGNPVVSNVQPDASHPTTRVIEYYYNNAAPPNTLIFENGVLTGRR